MSRTHTPADALADCIRWLPHAVDLDTHHGRLVAARRVLNLWRVLGFSVVRHAEGKAPEVTP